MGKYILRRLLMMIPVMFGVTVLIFTMLYLTPGNPAVTILGENATDSEIEELRVKMGLDQPYIVQLGTYIKKVVLEGNLGVSYLTGRPVTKEIVARYPTTMLLAILSSTVAVVIAIPLGILSATHQNQLIDTVARLVSLIGVSMPSFWQALVFILVFSVNLNWLPATGFYGPLYWILPAFTIGIHSSSAILRTTRSSMLETIRQDYIRTARAKGAAEHTVIWRHALMNALIPVITIVGLHFGGALGGSIVIESIFSIPGLGKLMIDAIKARNYPVVQGGVLLMSITFSLINLLVDILYAFIDPRIKSQYGGRKKKSDAAKGQTAKAVA